MLEAARLAPKIQRPTWILAKKQTDARGRRGRKWVHPDGNLAATLVMRPDCSPQEAARRSFLAANALLHTISLYFSGGDVALKWPNDVLINGYKVAGILLEANGNGQKVDWMSIGIGVNLANTPNGVTEAVHDPVNLASICGYTIPPEEFLLYLAEAYDMQEKILQQFGFERIRKNWLKHAIRLGQDVTARMPNETVTGRFITIDSDGNLVLETAQGERLISAADIHF